MFTGIIADVGTIADKQERDGGLRLRIETNRLGMEDVQLGDSIAVNGICLTAIQIEGNSFTVDVSRETLNCTVGLEQQGAQVNLEKALRLADRLGGHLVSGHVDGVGEVMDFVNLGESWKLVVHTPHELSKYIAAKGSVTINGVSLTVNKIEGTAFEVNLIPHTLQETSLKGLHVDSRVNLEIDLIARYVERMMSSAKQCKW
jgi:riboflavin synthase